MKKIIVFGNQSKKESGVIFVTSKDFEKAIKYNQTIIDTYNEIVNLHDKKFEDIPLPNLFVYHDVSILWLCFHSLMRLFLKLNSFIIEFSNFIEKENPDLIKIENNFQYFNIIKQICDEKKIRIKYSQIDLIKYQLIENLNLKKKKYGMNFIQKRNYKNRKKIYDDLSKNTKINLKDKVVFNLFPRLRRDIINLKTGEMEKGEDLVQNVIRMIQENHSIYCIEPLNSVRANQDVLKQRLKSEFPWIPLEILLLQNKNKERKNFLKNYLRIISSNKFQNLFEIKGIKIGKELEKSFLEMSFSLNLPSWLELIDTLYVIFSREKPKAVFLHPEFESVSQIFITICKKFGIKTIGIEHGVSDGPLWLKDRLTKSKKNLMFPIPEKQLVFGKISKQAYINAGYHPNDVIVFGNPNYFHLDKLKEILSSKDLFSKFGLDKKQINILFTTSGMEDYYDKKIWKYLLKYFQSKKEFQLILKPHPIDNPLFYESMINEFSDVNAKVIKGNFYEILFISSILVSARSTTITDAMVFEKSVIEVKFDKNITSIIDDYENGILVSDIDNLGDNILKLLNDKNLQVYLNKKNEKLIKDLYNIPEEHPEKILDKLLS